MGHPFSAVQRPIVAVLGQFKGHAKQTWCTSLELNWPFLRRVGLIMRSVPKYISISIQFNSMYSIQYIFRDTDHVFRDTGLHIARQKHHPSCTC